MVIRNLKALVEVLRNEQTKKLKALGKDGEELKDKVVFWVNLALTTDQALANITKRGSKWFGDEPQAGGKTCTLLLPVGKTNINFGLGEDELKDATLDTDVWRMEICNRSELLVGSHTNCFRYEDNFYQSVDTWRKIAGK